MSDKLDNLSKSKGKRVIPSTGSKVFNIHKRKIRKLCESLTNYKDDYEAWKTYGTIKNISKEKELEGRILYSEVSNYVFGLDEEKRGLFATNLEALLLYVFDEENKVDEEPKKIVIKIYDHFNLAAKQLEVIDVRFKTDLDMSKEQFKGNLREIEKDYITILGIFASIVLTFVGGMAFSTSVLENISNASIYRILMVTGTLGIVLINVIYLLLKFILSINGKTEIKDSINVKYINILLGIGLVLVVIGWFVDIELLQGRFTYWFNSVCSK